MFRFTMIIASLCVLVAISESFVNKICGPVCLIYCEYGNVRDQNGCPTCSCRSSPSKSSNVCGNGQAPLEDYFCGRGYNRRNCPSTHYCSISPVDAYAVCCPR